MIISDADLKILSNFIMAELNQEFEKKHLSKNLIKTVKVIEQEGEIRIEIPAQTYNMKKFLQDGVVIHTSHGSYASKLDKEGSSFMAYPGQTRAGSRRISPGNHKGFVDKIIASALTKFMAEKNLMIASREEKNDDQ